MSIYSNPPIEATMTIEQTKLPLSNKSDGCWARHRTCLHLEHPLALNLHLLQPKVGMPFTDRHLLWASQGDERKLVNGLMIPSARVKQRGTPLIGNTLWLGIHCRQMKTFQPIAGKGMLLKPPTCVNPGRLHPMSALCEISSGVLHQQLWQQSSTAYQPFSSNYTGESLVGNTGVGRWVA